MNKIGILGLSIITFLIASCSSFDEGGWKSKADNRLPGTWKLSSYYRNNIDATSTLLITGYTETYSEDGSYSRTYIDDEQETESETGSWKLNDTQEILDISGVGSISDFSTNNSSVSSSKYTILRLKKDEYWYTYENGGDTHEFRLDKQ